MALPPRPSERKVPEYDPYSRSPRCLTVARYWDTLSIARRSECQFASICRMCLGSMHSFNSPSPLAALIKVHLAVLSARTMRFLTATSAICAQSLRLTAPRPMLLSISHPRILQKLWELDASFPALGILVVNLRTIPNSAVTPCTL